MAGALEGITLYVAWRDGQPGPMDPPGTAFDGMEAWLAPQSEAFVARLGELGIPVTIETGPGTHTMAYVEQGLHAALPLLRPALDDD